MALVIGNGGYTALKSLPNPKKDAAAVARALKGLGYRLVDRDGKPTDKAELDLDQKGLFRAVNALAQAAEGQEIAFLYYAGHGFQDGANSYLVPVDAPKPERADDLDILKSRSIALDRVLGKVDGKAQLMVAVFDACREIPELNTAVRASGLGGDNNPYQGLLPVYRGGIREPAGQATRTSRLIAYAGAAGQLVKDGAGEHSPYTELLLDQLTAATQKNKNIELTEFFQGVAWQFKSDPGGRQQPLLEVAAQPDTFYLLPGRPASAPEPPSATTGTLVIRSSQPPGVVIYVNGGRLGSAPQSLNLPAGQQATVTAKQAGYEEYQEKVWIQAGQRSEINVVLTATPDDTGKDRMQNGKWPIFVEGFEHIGPEGEREYENEPATIGSIHQLKSNVELLPATSPLDHYVENLQRIAPDKLNQQGCKGYDGHSLFDLKKLQVKLIGEWYGYQVFDVLYKVFDPDDNCTGHRSIVLRDAKGNHRILYTQFSPETIGYIQEKESAPHLVRLNNYIVLAYRLPQSGTGESVIEYYFLFDEKSGLPVPLDLSPIEQKLKALLPKNREVFKGGGFDIETLQYEHAVWNVDKDPNCCPTGGRVILNLAIQNHQLTVINEKYEPRYRYK